MGTAEKVLGEEVRVAESGVAKFGRSVGIYGNYAIVGGTGSNIEQGIANIYQMKY